MKNQEQVENALLELVNRFNETGEISTEDFVSTVYALTTERGVLYLSTGDGDLSEMGRLDRASVESGPNGFTRTYQTVREAYPVENQKLRWNEDYL